MVEQVKNQEDQGEKSKDVDELMEEIDRLLDSDYDSDDKEDAEGEKERPVIGVPASSSETSPTPIEGGRERLIQLYILLIKSLIEIIYDTVLAMTLNIVGSKGGNVFEKALELHNFGRVLDTEGIDLERTLEGIEQLGKKLIGMPESENLTIEGVPMRSRLDDVVRCAKITLELLRRNGGEGTGR